MEYIKKAHARTKEKEEKDKKTALVKKEAVKKLRLDARKAKRHANSYGYPLEKLNPYTKTLPALTFGSHDSVL